MSDIINKQSGSLERLPKVAIISDARFPHHSTNTQQVVKNADALAAAGLPVELVIPVQAKGLFKSGYRLKEKIYNYYNVPGRLKIKQLPTIPASDLRLEKYTHCFAGLSYATSKKFDIVYTRNELTAFLSILFGKKTVYETYRKYGDEYPRLTRWLSKWAHKPACLGMVLHSRLSYNSMINAGFPEKKLAVFHNGFDYSDMLPMLNKTEARQILRWNDEQRYIVYTGNMQINKSIESVIDIACKLPAIKFILVGGTNEDIERLKNYAAGLKVENVLFTGFKPINEVSKYLYAADALIIPPVSAPLEKYGKTVLPFKTFLYLAAGRPIIAPKQNDLTEVLENEYNALLVQPDNLDDCVSAINRLFSDPLLHLSISENAASSVENMTWEKRAQKIIEWLTAIHKGNYPQQEAPTVCEELEAAFPA